MVLPLYYPLSVQYYLGQLTDPVSHALFVLALICVVQDRWITLAAALAFQAVAADSTAPDSVAGAARIRLQRIGLNPAGTVPAEPRLETR